jgi:hypothetical protein
MKSRGYAPLDFIEFFAPKKLNDFKDLEKPEGRQK